MLPLSARVDLGAKQWRGNQQTPELRHYRSLTIRQSLYSAAPADWVMASSILITCEYFLIRSISPIDGVLICTTTWGLSGSGSNGHGGVLHALQNLNLTTKCILVSYPDTSLYFGVVSHTLQGVHSVEKEKQFMYLIKYNLKKKILGEKII